MTASSVRLIGDLWKPLPKQREFLDASKSYRYLLYGGSRGSAKSHTLRWGSLTKLLAWAQRGLTGVRVGLFSEDYPTLRDRQITKIQQEFPPWLGRLRDSQTDGLGFYLEPGYGGGVILLRNLDDPQKYVGAEFAGAAVEELTRIPKATFDALRGSLRWPGIPETYFWGATNPLGVGLLWVRGLWIERDFPPELVELGPQFHYVRALPTDNPHLTPEYWGELRSQPAHIQRAWIDGDWYIPVGVMFEELRPATHQVDDAPPASRATLELAADWGYEHAAVALWIETLTQPNGRSRSRVYREHVTNRTTPEEWARQVLARSNGEPIHRMVLDSAAWNRSQDGAMSPAEQMVPIFAAAGIGVQPVSKAAVDGIGSRVRGWQLLHAWFRVENAEPSLVVSRSCRTLWGQLTTLVRGEPPHSIEDTAPGQTDDAATALRYYVTMRPGLPPGLVAKGQPDDDTHPGYDWDRAEKRKKHYIGELEEAPRGWRNRGPTVKLEDE